jgi:hypothetical protein
VLPPLTDFTLVKKYDFIIVLKDNYGATNSYSFSVTITNSEPVFDSPLPLLSSPFVVHVGQTMTFTLPPTTDAERHSITVLNDL